MEAEVGYQMNPAPVDRGQVYLSRVCSLVELVVCAIAAPLLFFVRHFPDFLLHFQLVRALCAFILMPKCWPQISRRVIWPSQNRAHLPSNRDDGNESVEAVMSAVKSALDSRLATLAAPLKDPLYEDEGKSKMDGRILLTSDPSCALYRDQVVASIASEAGAALLRVDSILLAELAKVPLGRLGARSGRTGLPNFFFWLCGYQGRLRYAMDALALISSELAQYGPLVVYIPDTDSTLLEDMRSYDAFRDAFGPFSYALKPPSSPTLLSEARARGQVAVVAGLSVDPRSSSGVSLSATGGACCCSAATTFRQACSRSRLHVANIINAMRKRALSHTLTGDLFTVQIREAFEAGKVPFELWLQSLQAASQVATSGGAAGATGAAPAEIPPLAPPVATASSGSPSPVITSAGEADKHAGTGEAAVGFTSTEKAAVELASAGKEASFASPTSPSGACAAGTGISPGATAEVEGGSLSLTLADFEFDSPFVTPVSSPRPPSPAPTPAPTLQLEQLGRKRELRLLAQLQQRQQQSEPQAEGLHGQLGQLEQLGQLGLVCQLCRELEWRAVQAEERARAARLQNGKALRALERLQSEISALQESARAAEVGAAQHRAENAELLAMVEKEHALGEGHQARAQAAEREAQCLRDEVAIMRQALAAADLQLQQEEYYEAVDSALQSPRSQDGGEQPQQPAVPRCISDRSYLVSPAATAGKRY
eukprot:jgi/Mesen1/4777/ME000242S03951